MFDSDQFAKLLEALWAINDSLKEIKEAIYIADDNEENRWMRSQ